MPSTANTAMREMGIILFLACVGLKAGEHFVPHVAGPRWSRLVRRGPCDHAFSVARDGHLCPPGSQNELYRDMWAFCGKHDGSASAHVCQCHHEIRFSIGGLCDCISTHHVAAHYRRANACAPLGQLVSYARASGVSRVESKSNQRGE